MIASDKEGQRVSDILEIMVRQYSRSRLVNHQFNIEFSFTDWDPAATKHWEWMVREHLKYVYAVHRMNYILHFYAYILYYNFYLDVSLFEVLYLYHCRCLIRFSDFMVIKNPATL